MKWLAVAGLTTCVAGSIGNRAGVIQRGSGRVHTYYVAADEVDWNYAPSGVDKMMGMEFMGYAKVVTEHGPHRIGDGLPQSDLSRIHGRDVYHSEAPARKTTWGYSAREHAPIGVAVRFKFLKKI